MSNAAAVEMRQSEECMPKYSFHDGHEKEAFREPSLQLRYGPCQHVSDQTHVFSVPFFPCVDEPPYKPGAVACAQASRLR